MKKSELKQIIKEEVRKLLNEATRSRVGILKPDGTVMSIYVHHDGGLNHLGKVLKQNYKDPSTVVKMINSGDASALYPKLSGTSKHSFANPETGVSIFYGRDRGDVWKKVKAKKHQSAEKYIYDSDDTAADYVYLYDTKTRKWLYVDPYKDQEFKEY